MIFIDFLAIIQIISSHLFVDAIDSYLNSALHFEDPGARRFALPVYAWLLSNL
jgi:hypothetical protein